MHAIIIPQESSSQTYTNQYYYNYTTCHVTHGWWSSVRNKIPKQIPIQYSSFFYSHYHLFCLSLRHNRLCSFSDAAATLLLRCLSLFLFFPCVASHFLAPHRIAPTKSDPLTTKHNQTNVSENGLHLIAIPFTHSLSLSLCRCPFFDPFFSVCLFSVDCSAPSGWLWGLLLCLRWSGRCIRFFIGSVCLLFLFVWLFVPPSLSLFSALHCTLLHVRSKQFVVLALSLSLFSPAPFYCLF